MAETSDSAFCDMFLMAVSLKYLLILDSEVSAAFLKSCCIAQCRPYMAIDSTSLLMMLIFEGFLSLEMFTMLQMMKYSYRLCTLSSVWVMVENRSVKKSVSLSEKTNGLEKKCQDDSDSILKVSLTGSASAEYLLKMKNNITNTLFLWTFFHTAVTSEKHLELCIQNP